MALYKKSSHQMLFNQLIRRRVGEMVQQMRLSRGIKTQQHLADLLGVSRGYVNMIENGRVGVPDETWVGLAVVFGVTTERLYRLVELPSGTYYDWIKAVRTAELTIA